MSDSTGWRANLGHLARENFSTSYSAGVRGQMSLLQLDQFYLENGF